LKKRGLASLLIVSIIAIAAVFGVVFAFQNAGRETDVYGSVTVTVDKPNIELEIKLEKDATGDKKFRIIKTPSSSAYFTITVGGLPDSADRAVELNESSISSGMVSVTRVTPLAESGKTGINTFMVNGENGGAPITMTFTTRSGGQTVAVNVNVKMIAKDMKVASSSHFGIRQGGDDLNLMSTDILNKFIFFAHPEDSERKYTPNNFPVQYRLKDEALYPGVILRDGILSVTEAASCVDQYIYVQAKLPAMDETEWIDVPFYVFPKADNIIVKTNAYKAANTAANVWDLIANRTEFSSANFEFELDCLKTGLSDYGFEVRSADPQIVRVDHVDQYQRSLSTVQNLGEVAINITAYPIIKDGGKEIYFNDETDANVKVQDTIYIRARNEFHTQDEAGIYGTESFHLTSSKETLNAFYYEGNHYSQAYFDVFDIDTFNGKTVNLDTEVEFELLVEDFAGDMSGTYGWNPAENPDQTIGLFSVLQIGYWSNKANDWVMLSGEANNYYAHYLNRFCVSFMRTANAQKFLSPNMELKLRVKTVNKLTIDEYADCVINLDATSAVDKFEVTNLTEFEDGGLGIALVYDTKQQSFSYQEVDVYGKIAKNSANGSIRYENSKKWNTAKVTDDRGDLPFVISSVAKNSNDLHYLTYRITANNIGAIEYYKDYPLTLEYPNGTTFTFNVRVYPTVETLTMSAISNSRGKIHKTITYDDNSEYDYVRTMYVRKGYTYELAVDTQGVTVGAYAMFDSVCDENGNVISSTTSKMIDARNLAEGLYECSVSLHAYSNEVYGNNKRNNIVVYVVVVNPVGNVVIPENVKLEGINDSAEIALEMTSLENKTITDDAYLHIEVAEPLNPNVAVEQGSKFNRFRITAKYLMEDVFNVGFKIYKSYNFPAEFDLDGRAWTDNEAVVFNYVGGAVINTKVSITNSKPNKIIIAEGVKESANIGNYLELVSGPQDVVESEVEIGVADDAKYKAYGLAVVQWKNGQFVLDPFALKEGELAVGDCAVARIGAQTGNVYIKPVAGKTSMGVYGLVVYASDSLRYVGVDNAGNDLVLPDVYQVISLYVGTAEDIKATVDDLNSGVPHDANSGQRNTRGGYNWIWKSTKPGAAVAILFYTPGAETNNGFQANMYYVDDLYTVLGWPGLKNPNRLTLTKYVNDVRVGGDYVIKKENGRLRIDLNRVYDNNDTIFYSGYFNQDQTIYTTVKFEVRNNDTSAVYVFYVVKGLNTFDVMIESTSVGSGLVARKNLNPKEYANAIDSVTMQRGNKFNFIADMDSGWELNSHNFDAAESQSTGSVTYAGGTYTFTPKIKIGGYEFDVDALTATVKVNVKGGVNYLNISQDSVTLDGVTTAAYDLTMRSDQKIWSPSLLNYKFLYDGVYYDLFENDETVSYINMEGGKSKLEFKLKCLNEDPVPVNLYYTYYMRIEVAVVVTVPDVDPFYNISGSRLFVEENLSDSPLMGVKTPATDSAGFNLTKQGIYNVTMAHFADTSADEDNKSALILADGQTDNGVIYLDKSAGGLLVVYPTPYYINVANISLWTSQPHSEKVLIGNDLSGKPIYDTVSYTIGFTQMVYNEDLKYYQPYISTTGTTPQMISSWSKAEGYKWTGKYYFKTSIVSSTHVSHRLSDGTKFEISVSIQGESNAKAITETMTIQAKYRNSFVINPDDTVENFAVCTMTQTQYQALGTTAVYDVAFPIDCVPNYSAITLNGTAIAGKVVETKHAIVRVDTVAQTLSVYLKANSSSIGADIEIRIPYQRPGDYVNPYLSVVIVPVYFELDELDVVNHYESRLQITREELTNLQYRASFKYDSAVYNSSLSAKMTSFNNNLKTSNLISYDFETAGQITLEFSYTYVDGIPVISKNSILRYIKTFYYDIVDVKPLVQRTEYLAVGTSATYTFNNWDPMHVAKLYAEGSGSNSATINGLWETNITRLNNNNVAITVSLVNKNGSMANHEAYDALVNAGKIVINIFSTADRVNSQLELTIIPVYFTFTEFKLQNNPVNPIVALSTPTVVTVEAGGISCVEDPTVSNAISQFNTELLNAQNNLSNISSFTFNRVANDDGVLNFSFDSTKRSIVRADSSNPITATSYLLVSAYVSYVKGIPTLNTKGQKVTTYLPVATYGEDFGSDGTLMPDLETAPNGRTRTIAQAIGTSVRYNIALAGVAYDSRLDKYEIKADGSFVDWNKDSGWNAIFNVKESTVAVNLKENINLFNKVLTVMAYSRTGELMYVLNIVPAYFTVEQLLLADHIDESPVMIKDEPNWLNNLALDFKTTYSNSLISVFEAEIADFKNTLNTSSLVSRLDDAGYITLYTGVNYEDGIPTLVNLVNAKTTVQNTFRYVLYDGIPENTKAQALGQEVVYNVNRTAAVIKISTGKDSEGKDIWQTYDAAVFADSGWWIDGNLSNPRCIKVGLDNDENLIGKTIRIGIYVNDDDEEPAYILNIVPAYFTVEDITVAGQSVEDRDIYFYYGDEFDSPEDLIFDAIYGKYLNTPNVVSQMSFFEYELQKTKAGLIVREYDADAMSGNLHVTVYLDYTTGNPTIVDETTENACVVRLDVDFNYTVFGKTSFDSEFPPMPNGPRTRTEIQAIGTTASYTIDLNKNLSLDVNYLKDDANRGWKISFEENVLTVELRPSKVEQLLANDVVFEFYVGYEVVYVLTIQPVLFEVVGIETNRPEQPVTITGSVDALQYRVIAKYNNAVSYQGHNVISYIETLNQMLNSQDSLLEIENIEDQYLKLSAAFDYGVAGSKLREVPELLNVENYPLQTVESYVEIETNGDSTEATHYQAVGTTVYYNLGIDYENATILLITIGGQDNHGEVTCEIVEHGTSYALRVKIEALSNLLGKDIVIVIDNDADEFTMTIKPVLFLVEGFDVINHPEQHMWLINSLEQKEDVDNLLYRVRARYSGDQALQDRIKEAIEVFNQLLAVYNDQTRQWEAGNSAGNLETYTIGGAYLVVRAGIKYTNGLPIIVDVNHVKPTQVVRDVFKYARYSDRIDSNNLVKPNIPRSRTVELTIGHSAVYTLDFEELAGFSQSMIALYENTDSTNADDDSKLVRYVNDSNGWQVSVNNDNQLCVTLQPNADLVKRELKVFIYYEKGHVNDEPNSYDVENVAFILTIRPVWFKVTGIALNGYSDDEVKVDTIDQFMGKLSAINDTYFVPTFEYSDAVLKQDVVGAELQTKMNDFTDEFKSSPFVTITRTREDANTYHFQVTTAVTYEPFTGEAVLADDAARLIWNSFKVVVDPSAAPVEERVENQAIGTTKTYYIDADILDGVNEIANGANYTVKWDKNQANINYVTVTLNDNATVGTQVEVAIGNDFVLKINPVYFEILGFETVAHPEREVWVVSPYTVEDLKYRVITTEISNSFTTEVLAAVEQALADLNLTLNSSAPVSITTDSNQNIIFDAAVNYANGYPEIVEITKDKRNVVESIIPYRIWSANIRPKPEHPSVVGSTKSNQVIGGTKAYTLKRIRGQVFYQHLWVENGGELVTPFADSSNGTTQVYEGLSIMVDPARNSMKIQLAADAKYLAQPIRVYLPYMTLVNGKDVWYSHCIEITPLLFELKGWTITARDPLLESHLYKHKDNPYYLLLTKDSTSVIAYKFDALINYSVTDANLINQIKNAESQLEVLAENVIEPVLLTEGNISFNGLQLNRLVPADEKTDNIVGLSTYIVYENGVPKLVDSSKTLVSNQILISTGYSINEWNPNVQLGAGSLYQVQAIGTSQTYDINIIGAGKIFTNQIKAVNANGNPISIPGEQSNLVMIECEDFGEGSAELKVDLAPVVALRNEKIEIRIPYAEDIDAENPEAYYTLSITPVIFAVEGFYLEAAADNNLELSSKDVPLILHVQASYSEDVNLRNMVNYMLKDFESRLNQAIQSDVISFTITNVSGSQNAEILGQSKVIHQKVNKTAVDIISAEIKIGYNSGIPQLIKNDEHINVLTDEVFNYELTVNTMLGFFAEFPGWNSIEEGNITNEDGNKSGNKFLQAIGTSRLYGINVKDLNITFYHQYIKVFNAGGTLSGLTQNEHFALVVKNAGYQSMDLEFSLRATAQMINDWIDIRIPYTVNDSEGSGKWFYYSVKIKPVLFEIKSWKLKLNRDLEESTLVDEVVLHNSAVELYFAPEVVTGPLNLSCYMPNELEYIKNAINRLEIEINTYDELISDGYEYIVINNLAQEGYQVNYTIFRDNNTNKTYMVRDSNRSSTTVMDLSAYIAYNVSDANKNYVDSAHAVTSYIESDDAHRVNGQIMIHTTDNTTEEESDRSKVFITQENARQLMSLRNDVDYILMSDIYLDEIAELDNGRWKPVPFPTNATFDGNNFRIFLNSTGFDLSGKPTNIGLFTEIPKGSVVKNVQIAFEQDVDINKITQVDIDLGNYTEGQVVNIGLLAGINNGIVTNCAVLSEWQFKMRNSTSIYNPVTKQNFEKILPFNKDGKMFDDQYFYLVKDNVVTQVYDEHGYGFAMTKSANGYELALDDATNKPYIKYDNYHNVVNWTPADRTIVANYDDYSPIMMGEFGNTVDKKYDAKSAAKLYVYANNDKLSVTLGGLIGTNNYMVTNSRVLIDVELYGPAKSTDAGHIDEISVLNSTVGGFIGVNAGTITTSFFRDGSVINNANADVLKGNVSLLGGFVGHSTGTIMQSYAMGCSVGREDTTNGISSAGAVRTIRNSLGAFVHLNGGTINDCMVNMVIDKSGTEGEAGGFVYQNTNSGRINNCVENNNILVQGGSTMDYYSPFIVINGQTKTEGKVVTNNLSNLIYAGNAISASFSDDWLKPGILTNLAGSSEGFNNIENYSSFSMGSGKENTADCVSAKNTVWEMTSIGPKLRAANDIAISYRKYAWNSSPYLYNPGTEKNPYVIWTAEQFNDYIYGASPYATNADEGVSAEKALTNIEKNRQSNHIRLIDNITLNGIQDTYKVVYTGTFEGNGLTMKGISLDTSASDLATMGLFGKTEYATIRNINFEIGNINSIARYVGGIAGIAINTSFVDVKVTSNEIKGANIVGGFVGLNVVNDSKVEYYNLNSSVSATASFQRGQTDVSAEFTSGIEYVHQTLYARLKPFDSTYEQGFGTAGSIFGFITSNPNNYRTVDAATGKETITARNFVKTIHKMDASGEYYGEPVTASSLNSEAEWFLKDSAGKVINDNGVYYKNQIILRRINGAVNKISANVAGGLIGIMDETIELHNPKVTRLSGLTGKYYLGGIVGINLGKIVGGTTEDEEGNITTYNAMSLSSWTVASSAGSLADSPYIFRNTNDINEAKYLWGMSVGAVAGYNNGLIDNTNSGVIQNIHVNANVLAPSDGVKIYAIGGIVGANGAYGYVDNAVNTNNNVKNDRVEVTSAQAQKVGYYFGSVIGRSDVASSALTKSNDARMMIMQMDFPTKFSANSYISKKYFGYNKNVANHFKVANEETSKIQTYTLAEYREWLLTTIKLQDLPTRIEMLNPWVRTLPTVVKKTKINNKEVWVEVFEENKDEKLNKVKEFKDWIETNEIFEIWDPSHSALRNNVVTEYYKYLEYSAVSDEVVAEQDENTFISKLEQYRATRDENALEFFTYQYQIGSANSVATKKNAEFKWEDYQSYLTLKKFVDKNENLNSYNSHYDMRMNYGNTVANILNVDSKEGYFEINQTGEVTKDNYGIICDMFYNYKKAEDKFAIKFTNEDPLQAYINYIVNLNAGTFTINGYDGTLAQEYYYMMYIYGNDYPIKEYTYSVPKNFGEVGNDGYIAYLQLSKSLLSSGTLLTIGEFIYMMAQENEIVMDNEEAWIKTGHRGNGSTRISEIGAVALEWETAANWTSEKQGTVTKQDNVLQYGDNENKQWEAFKKYNEARSYGMDIAKYKEMISLGGSLYEFLNLYEDKNEEDKNATDKDQRAARYIFSLKAEQYGWTQKQSDFIMTNFSKDGAVDMNYGLAATTTGNILGAEYKGSVRAVYENKKTQVFNSSDWFTDEDGNGEYFSGEVLGVWQLPYITDAKFKNGDGMEYQFGRKTSINLFGDGTKGAALYVDDGNKMFGEKTSQSGSASVGKDTLILYEVFNENNVGEQDMIGNVDFWRKEEDGTLRFFNIARKIVNNPANVNSGSEETENDSDYLEEALWWKNEGFTAEEFDRIKNNAMVGHNINANGRVMFDGVQWKREKGFTVADDWYAKWKKDDADVESGFKTEEFTPAEYTEIATGAKYVDGKWYSTYADYKLFTQLNYVTTQAENDRKININEIKAAVPDGDTFNVPFKYNKKDKEYETGEVANIASENELANAMDFASERAAFLEMFRAGGSTADYITWSGIKDPTAENSFVCKIGGNNRFFRLNHYIYYMKNDLVNMKCITSDGEKPFEPADLQWVLTQSVRADIMYADITQESLTTDLVTYRRDWFNKGYTPFITYRDYCEWINIYAYDDNYQTDRGDMAEKMENEMGGTTGDTGDTGTNEEQLKSTDGWLTIEAFAVWKRMEKYENNVEYIAKASEYAPKQTAITAPILKRQISTTVFPHIHNSGVQTFDEETGKLLSDKYTIQTDVTMTYVKNPNSNGKYDDILYVYGWCDINHNMTGSVRAWYFTEYENNKVDPNHLRPVYDRFEYNESYNKFVVENRFNNKYHYKNTPASILEDKKFAQDCIHTYDSCNDHTHAKYIVKRWFNRYGSCYVPSTQDNLSLKLDENTYEQTNTYLQFYIPYDTFKSACRQIKASYTQSGKEKGYANYMQYWARNGSFTDICDLSAYPHTKSPSGQHQYRLINNTYLATDFWSKYDGSRDPFNGAEYDGKKAVGW